MNAFFFALAAYLINAGVAVVDKYLLQTSIPRPFAYAFWASFMSIFTILLIPLGVVWPGWDLIGIAVLSGVANFIGLIFLFRAVKMSNISIASTKYGAFSVLATYIFSLLILDYSEIAVSWLSLAFFASGIFVLTKVDRRIIFSTALGGSLFGLSLVLLKLFFNHSTFIDGIFWTRIGFAITPLFTLLLPAARHEITMSLHESSSGSRTLFISNKVLATFGFVILYYAIRIGDVALVNALSGAQFVFVLVLALMVRKKLGIIEDASMRAVEHKIAGVILVALGFLSFLL